MRAVMGLISLALVACSTGRNPPGSASVRIPGPKTPAQCATDSDEGCRYEVVVRYYCGGTPPPYDGYGTSRVCLCHECDADADCGGDARCVALAPFDPCDTHPRRVCVAPDEPCYPGTTCPDGQRCGLRDGQPACDLEPGPPI